MTENNQLSCSDKHMKKCPTCIAEQLESTENPKYRISKECGKCETEVPENNGQPTTQSSQIRIDTPHKQELQAVPTAHHAEHASVSLPKQSQEESQISGIKQEVSMNKRFEELTIQKTQIEVHMQALRRRSQVLNNTSDQLKQQMSEQYDDIRKKLNKDEQATLELIEEDTRIAVGKLNKAIEEGNQQLEQVRRSIKRVQIESQQKYDETKKQDDKLHKHSDFNKKTCSTEQFAINTSRFQKLLKLLENISQNLQAKLLQKSLLLDQTPVLLDAVTSNKNIFISEDQTTMCLVSEPQNMPNNPLRFDMMYNVLASSGWLRGKHYWEVDVRSSPAWSIGMAYGSIERKGKQKSVKLGRNRLSWCVELHDRKLLAWHNDKAILCGKGLSGMKQVGVHVDCERSKIVFYNAESMKVLQEFSSSTAAFFDRLQHHFVEAVFPAVCLFSPKSGTITFERLQLCNSPI